MHSALKLEKKCNFKRAKNTICIFKNGKKSIFITRKKFKTTKNAIFRVKCSSDCLANSLTCLSKKEEFFLRKTKNSFNSICPDKPLHSALKLEKKCNFKSAKKHYLHFQKWQEINFCSRKKFKISFLVVLNFFVVQNFWNCKKCVFVLLKLHIFLILEHCVWWLRFLKWTFLLFILLARG